MHQKTNRHTAFKLNYQLFFSFSEQGSVSIEDREKLKEIMVALFAAADSMYPLIDIEERGAKISFAPTGFIDIPKLVNKLKTHSSRQLAIHSGAESKKIWGRGYGIATTGLPLSSDECFSLLKNN